jgi:hypothetical protein
MVVNATLDCSSAAPTPKIPFAANSAGTVIPSVNLVPVTIILFPYEFRSLLNLSSSLLAGSEVAPISMNMEAIFPTEMVIYSPFIRAWFCISKSISPTSRQIAGALAKSHGAT